MAYQDSHRDCSNFICSNNSGKKKKVEMASTLARRWLPGVSELPSRHPPPRCCCCCWKVCPAETLIAPRGGQTPNSEEPSLPRLPWHEGGTRPLPSFRPSTNIDLTTIPYFWSYRGKPDILERISVAEKGTVCVGLSGRQILSPHETSEHCMHCCGLGDQLKSLGSVCRC